MKLLLLNVHLEWNHNRLRKLVEKDTREGMDEVFQVMYDIEGYKKKKKSLESLLQEKPKEAEATNFELSEEETTWALECFDGFEGEVEYVYHDSFVGTSS